MRDQVKRILRRRLLKEAYHPAAITAPIGAVIGAGVGGYRAYKRGESVWGGAGKGALAGGAAGALAGFAPMAAASMALPAMVGIDKGTSQMGKMAPKLSGAISKAVPKLGRIPGR